MSKVRREELGPVAGEVAKSGPHVCGQCAAEGLGHHISRPCTYLVSQLRAEVARLCEERDEARAQFEAIKGDMSELIEHTDSVQARYEAAIRALRYTWDNERTSMFDYDTWAGACRAVLGEKGKRWDLDDVQDLLGAVAELEE